MIYLKTNFSENLESLESEFSYWMDNHMITFDFNGENFTMARYNCTSNGPRPESYVEDFEVSFLSVCFSVCVCVCLSVNVSVCMLDLHGENLTMARYSCTSNGPRPESYVEDFEVYFSLCMSVCLSFCLFVCLSFCHSIYASVCMLD